ncbi:MAG: adenine phosphoribosyltransferase [Lachnospiraceae bacterium]|nr:adenine phosphoribosyltransferase [Lachnospiraceae bacterium]
MLNLDDYMISIPDFPEPGIIFRDITGILHDADAFHEAIDQMAEKVKDLEFDKVIGAESRGFILGSPIAYKLNKPFVLIRKKGKLPRKTISTKYDLEYGSAEIEMHADAIEPGQKVLLVDDLLATGGTLKASADLIERAGGIVTGIVVLVELAGLKGRDKLDKYRMDSCIVYSGK